AISDAEVNYCEQGSHLWHIRYPLSDGSGEIVVATTRPETMLGDTAVAVHPEDKRYKDFIGKTLILPLVNKDIPIVADEYVEMDFGSGAVKITPAHDPNDFEVGLRHNLNVIRVMNDDGTMNNYVPKYSGMDRYDARKAIEKDLIDGGYLVKKENYTHNVGECYRCKTTIETIVSKQWFVKMEPLAKPAINVVKKKKIEIIPERFSKTYFNWMENIKDWCISRQLWWGHRIPAYYCESCGHTVVNEEMPETCPKCGCTAFRQDEDVLDTWFSSALWPFSTLGYPDKTEDLAYFYPTNVLITAYDIIFFWVARMIFSGLEHMREIPFSDVLIHGIVRDELGRKMSKSLGNGVDPLEIIEKFGADSLRFSLSNGIATGGDTRFSAEKVESCRNFINKVWNASRFVLMNLEGVTIKDINKVNKTMADKWLLSHLNQTVRNVTKNLEKYEIGIAGSKLYDFVWSEFCDWYIELVKPVLYGDDSDKRADTMTVLVYALTEILKLLHPYIPFVTECIYQELPKTEESIMISSWPKQQKKFTYSKEAKQFEGIMEIVRTIRNIRTEVGVAPSKRVKILLVADESKSIINKCHSYIEKLAGVSEIQYITRNEVPDKVSSAVTAFAEIYISLGELVDAAKEIERLAAEIAKIEKEIERSESMLNNKGFVARAPQAVVDTEREKLLAYRDKYAKLNERIELLK
ncbi:valine--tRNA ligase, partial [Candidatus Nomurabacteria bacterium]|nr:valine--tRNA ligase [Candidatus Nomurabacteria bacterium]